MQCNAMQYLPIELAREHVLFLFYSTRRVAAQSHLRRPNHPNRFLRRRHRHLLDRPRLNSTLFVRVSTSCCYCYFQRKVTLMKIERQSVNRWPTILTEEHLGFWPVQVCLYHGLFLCLRALYGNRDFVIRRLCLDRVLYGVRKIADRLESLC